jgi:MarR family transcriptional regulator, lower aerobic nicotinate degradation pathway regulator
LVLRKLLIAVCILGRMAETTAAGQTAVEGQRLLPLINHLARVGRRAAESRISGCLRPRHMIALKLLGERGPMTQHALGIALSLDPSNVVGLLNELEDRDLITRRRDPADRRRHIVELTAAGSDEATLTYDQLGQVEDDLFKALTADERATVYELLSRAVAALAPADEPSGCVAPPSAASLAPQAEK